jgi:hypothetical protein
MARLRKSVGLASLVYVITWIVGLAVWPSNLSVTSTGQAVVTAYAAHRLPATVQFVLVEGVAALALGVVVMGLASRAARTIGLAACCISLLQCLIGVVLVTAVSSPGHVKATGTLFDAINRLDGTKMLTLAALIATIGSARRRMRLPGWLAGEGIVAWAALLASGAGYLAQDGSWANAAAASLPLLLLWVLGVGLTLRRNRRLVLHPFPRTAA